MASQEASHVHLMLDSHHVFRSTATELPVTGSRESENKQTGGGDGRIEMIKIHQSRSGRQLGGNAESVSHTLVDFSQI